MQIFPKGKIGILVTRVVNGGVQLCVAGLIFVFVFGILKTGKVTRIIRALKIP